MSLNPPQGTGSNNAPSTPHAEIALLWPLQQKSRFSITFLCPQSQKKGFYLCNERGYERSHSSHSTACSQAQSTRGCWINLWTKHQPINASGKFSSLQSPKSMKINKWYYSKFCWTTTMRSSTHIWGKVHCEEVIKITFPPCSHSP